jgi:hypothetical protein
VVEQITPVPMAIDVDAMFDAMACLGGQEDDGAAAAMRRVYLQKSEENATQATARMIKLVINWCPCPTRAVRVRTESIACAEARRGGRAWSRS